MKKGWKLILAGSFLPLAFLIDLFIWAATRGCPACGSFNQFITGSPSSLFLPAWQALSEFLFKQNRA